jgi:hypothetical protein
LGPQPLSHLLDGRGGREVDDARLPLRRLADRLRGIRVDATPFDGSLENTLEEREGLPHGRIADTGSPWGSETRFRVAEQGRYGRR